MLHKTRGIVFKTTNYAENSVVTQIFTEKFGLQSYMINGVKKAKSKIRMNVLQPLCLLDMIVYHKPNGNIQRASEIKSAYIFTSIPYNIVKSSLALFLNEVLYKSVKQQSAEEHLFSYIYNSIELLDRIEDGLANFHLIFMIRLTQFLGFYPDKTDSEANYFDLLNGAFTTSLPPHSYVLQNPHTTYFQVLLKGNFETLGQIQIPATERRFLLAKLLDYFRLHTDGFGQINAHQILEELFN